MRMRMKNPGADYLSDVIFPRHIVRKRGTATVMI